jgi:hypothetical protein
VAAERLTIMKSPVPAKALLIAPLAIVVLAALAPVTPAHAAVSEAAQAMVGTWEFSNANRDKRCTLTFRTDAGPAGMRLDFDKDCVNVFAFVKEIAAWSIAEHDFLRLLDAKGKPVLEFSEVESALFEAPRPEEGILFIQSAAAAGAPPKPAEQMAGEWNVVRGERTLCTLNLMNTPVGVDLAVRVRSGCDATVTRFAPTSWNMDRSELVLNGAREATWRFAEGDEGSVWHRVPETADPIMLVRR